MLYITDVLGNTATIDNELKIKSVNKGLAAALELSMAEIKPEESQAGNILVYVMAELERRGFDVQADTEDLLEAELPEGATS